MASPTRRMRAEKGIARPTMYFSNNKPELARGRIRKCGANSSRVRGHHAESLQCDALGPVVENELGEARLV